MSTDDAQHDPSQPDEQAGAKKKEVSSVRRTEREAGADRVFSRSEAPNASFEEGAGDDSAGFDAPPVGSINLSNDELHALDEGRIRKPRTGESGEEDGSADTTPRD